MRKRLMSMYGRLLDRFGPQGWWPGRTPFEVAVGAVLTQNTNWGNVERAIGNLKRERALSARAISSMNHRRLASMIRPAGYFNVKARRLKSFVAYLKEDYGGSMKRMAGRGLAEVRHDLLSVNGIGPETADSIILYALHKPVFVIDAYTKRVLSRHGMIDGNEDYEQVRSLFEGSLEPDVRMFNEFHALFVVVGKHLCRPRNPRCGECPLEGL
jgi:endonuclease-3 related protein